MKTIICDRCGKSAKLFDSVNLKLSSNKLFIRGNFDLCMDCYDKFKKFIGDEERNERNDNAL